MTNRTRASRPFARSCRGLIDIAFDGGDITSDGGSLLARSADLRLDLLRRVARLLPDKRRQASVEHSVLNMLRQRVDALALGYEDVNDHHELRHDLGLQTAVGRDVRLASTSSLSRFENRADRHAAWAIHRVLVDVFVEQLPADQDEIVLDFDATDDAVHGRQEGRFFHGYYDHYCFLPLYVFCGDWLLCAYLRPSNIDGAKHARPVLKLLVERIRQTRPNIRIIFRGDSGFCRWRMLRWCEKNDVGYIVGIAKNARLKRLAKPALARAERQYDLTGMPYREFLGFEYRAGTWDKPRRVIAKAEHLDKGSNPRFVVTNLKGGDEDLYDFYCARGESENRIKEQQLGLFADRTSCHAWWPNQFRLLLSALAYTLFVAIRSIGLRGTRLARAQVGTIRLKLLKIGAVVVRNTRRVRFMMSSAYPNKELFWLVAKKLAG